MKVCNTLKCSTQLLGGVVVGHFGGFGYYLEEFVTTAHTLRGLEGYAHTLRDGLYGLEVHAWIIQIEGDAARCGTGHHQFVTCVDGCSFNRELCNLYL